MISVFLNIMQLYNQECVSLKPSGRRPSDLHYSRNQSTSGDRKFKKPFFFHISGVYWSIFEFDLWKNAEFVICNVFLLESEHFRGPEVKTFFFNISGVYWSIFVFEIWKKRRIVNAFQQIHVSAMRSLRVYNRFDRFWISKIAVNHNFWLILTVHISKSAYT